MTIEEIPSPEPEGSYMIMRFDPRNAELIKFGDSYVASDHNLAEARREAQGYAEQAAAKRLPPQFWVVKTETVAAFRPVEDR